MNSSEVLLTSYLTDIETRLISGKSILTHPEDFSEEPIQWLIERMSTPEYTISESDYRELVIKYAYVFIHPEKLDATYNIKNIDAFFHLAEIFFLKSRFRGLSFLGEEVILKVFQILHPYGYAFSMVWDISPTAEIIQSIIEQKVINSSGVYQWLDLWTWSGILLLAQYIQGRRNGFSKFQNYGIEIDPEVVQRTGFLAERLWFGSVIVWNTTQRDIFQVLWIDSGTPPHFVSNECIPNTGLPLWADNDPFLDNTLNVFSYFEPRAIVEQTRIFPYGISLSIVGKEDSSHGITTETLPKLVKICQEKESYELVKQIMTPDGLQLSETHEWKALHDIGSNIGGVVPLPHWRSRWRTWEQYNSINEKNVHDVRSRLIWVRNIKEVFKRY